MKSISPFEANYTKLFNVPDIFNQGKMTGATARRRLAYLIDTSWFYSNYWPSDDHNAFLDKAQVDLNTEMDRANARIAQLKEAQEILSAIERYEEETEEETEEDIDCHHCGGTGIGMSGPADESKCIICMGRGYLLPLDEDE